MMILSALVGLEGPEEVYVDTRLLSSVQGPLTQTGYAWAFLRVSLCAMHFVYSVYECGWGKCVEKRPVLGERECTSDGKQKWNASVHSFALRHHPAAIPVPHCHSLPSGSIL